MIVFMNSLQHVSTTDSVAVKMENVTDIAKQVLVEGDGIDKIAQITQRLIEWGVSMGGRIIAALFIFIIGRFLISLVNKLVAKLMAKRDIDVSIQSFVKSLVKILLMVLLGVAIVSKLGIETTSFAALLASAGVAIGMALSGNLQNFAGGLVVLLFKPYKVGDVIEVISQNVIGTVKEIQIFHTILTTADNKVIFIPNAMTSSGVVVNYSHQTIRRLEWIVGVEYGEKYEKVKESMENLIAADARILSEPASFVGLHELAASSVNVVARVWVKTEDYWDVYFDINRKIYENFNAEGINFPFPQLTIHQSSN